MKTIKANVVYNRDHFKHKLLPGDKARVRLRNDNESKTLNKRRGQVGTVVAVVARSTWTEDFLGNKNKNKTARDGTSRQWNRYYLEFEDGERHGFYSWYLEKV